MKLKQTGSCFIARFLLPAMILVPICASPSFALPNYAVPNCALPNTALLDWGYDSNSSARPKEEVAPPAVLIKSPTKQQSVKSTAVHANAVNKPNLLRTNDGRNTNKDQAVRYWMELFDLISASPLTDEQKSRFQATLQISLRTNSAATLSICTYWPSISQVIAQNSEQKDNYKDLLRALMRQQQHLAAEGTATIVDADIVSELLGPVRIAVASTVAGASDSKLPLTEDAINAYADMACFLYEQKNPGKTLDGTDNRALFARVIADKFKDAPNEADKKAMAGFDLSWSKFKILWADADTDERRLLIEQLSSGTVGRVTSHNQNLELLLKAWSQAVAQSAKKAVQP